MMMISLFIYSVTIGPYTWVYIGEVGNEKMQALGLIFAQGIIQSLTINYMFDYFGENGTFWTFGGCCILAGVLMCIFMKETKGLTQEQTKVLYVPENLIKVQTVSTVEDPRQRDSYAKNIAGTIVSRKTEDEALLHAKENN